MDLVSVQFKDLNIKLVLVKNNAFPELISAQFYCYKSFLMTLFMVFKSTVRNADIKLLLSHEEKDGEFYLEHQFHIIMGTQNGIPPNKDLFDQEVDNAANKFSDSKPSLLIAINHYLRIFSMMTSVKEVLVDIDNFKLKSVMYIFKFKVNKATITDNIKLLKLDYNVTWTNPNMSVHEWDLYEKKEKSLISKADEASMQSSKEKLKRISDKLISRNSKKDEMISRRSIALQGSIMSKDSSDRIPNLYIPN